MELDPVLDRDGGEMGIRRQITSHANSPQQVKENLAMTVARMDRRDLWLREPGVDKPAGFVDRKRVWEDMATRRETEKSKNGDPGQGDRALL